MKFFYHLLNISEVELDALGDSSSLLHAQHELEGAGPTGQCPPNLPPSQRAYCLATTNRPKIFGGVLQPIQRVRAGFSALFLLVEKQCFS